ncbi:MAG: CCA tRNA nucleotidyltransferase [Pseudomonadota bacterium]
MTVQMKPVKTISQPDWVRHDSTQKLLQALDGLGEVPKTLFVGGCVRNLLMDLAVTDIDLATQIDPQEVVSRLEKNDIKAIPTGIEHGTVTAIIDDQKYEITTLRKDVKTDGRHALVSFSDDWIEDAKRRDFTINTFLMSSEGNVFDLLGNALKDLENQRVIFVGNADQRITEDALRILRFFRFHAFYGEKEPDQAALLACKENATLIDTLSRERITSEFLKILSVEDPTLILKVMFENNVLDALVDKNYQPEILSNLCSLQRQYDAFDEMARLFVINGCTARFHDEVLRLSHAHKNKLVKYDMAAHAGFYRDEKALKKAIFHHGNAILVQGYLLHVSISEIEANEALINVLKNWQAPECPVNGKMLLDEGYQTGPELGRELDYRIEEWLDHNL